jgi:hypothetical protein
MQDVEQRREQLPGIEVGALQPSNLAKPRLPPLPLEERNEERACSRLRSSKQKAPFDHLSREHPPLMCPPGILSPEGRSTHAERRSTISFLISAMALAGFRPFGQVRVQFMMVWQR